jgi:hypothetical protein
VKVPGADRAIVDDAKVRDYLLSSDHPIGRAKARFFRRLGFEAAHWRALQTALREHAFQEAEQTAGTPFGQKYLVRGMIQGPSGVAATVTSVWIVLRGEDVPRLVTVYPS